MYYEGRWVYIYLINKFFTIFNIIFKITLNVFSMIFYWFLLLILLVSLSGSNNRLLSLGEVVTHILLEIEVSEFISLLQLQKSLELGIRVDLATIFLVLEIVTTNVLVDFTGDISTSHFSALVLAQERGEFIRDTSGLNKARGLTSTSLSLLLGRSLLGDLQFTRPLSLQVLVFILQTSNQRTELVKLGDKFVGLSIKFRNFDGFVNFFGRGNRRGNDGSSNGSSSRCFSLLHGLLGSLGGGLLFNNRSISSGFDRVSSLSSFG